MSEPLRAILVGTGFLAIFAIAELIRRRWNPPVEVTRKFVHASGGLVALTFPWIFHSPWTVLVLGIASATTLTFTRKIGWLRSVHGVERASRGDLYFPIAVFVLFLIARDRPVFYAISLFTLVVADALAALLGKTYGKSTYEIESGRKSWEGSIAFFMATFLGVHLPLLLATDIDRATCVLVALQIALLVTSFEAISLRGSDNLIVPLGTWYLLVKMSPKTADAIAVQLAVQLGLLVLVALIAWRSRVLTASGAIAAHLVLYAAFSLGGPAWSVAPALALAGLVTFAPSAARSHHESGLGYQVLGVFYVSIVAVLLIFADNTFATFLAGRGPAGPHPFFVPFVAALAAQLGLVTYLALRTNLNLRKLPRLPMAMLAAVLGFTIIVPLSLWFVLGSIPVRAAAVAAGVCAISSVLYMTGRAMHRWPAGPLWDLRLQSLSVALAIGLLLPVHLLWGPPP